MKKFTPIKSKVVPLPLKDVDTDMIIPAQYLTSVTREGYGQFLFQRLREADAKFPLNDEGFAGSSILMADSNFGCGSSREHAVWALRDYGFRAVIAKSFADIFFNNSMKNGFLPITLPEHVVDALHVKAREQHLHLEIDLEKQVVILPDGSAQSFEFDAFRKHCILNALDDLEYLRADIDSIREHFKRAEARESFRWKVL